VLRQRGTQALTCVAVCAFMLGCGRWGAHLSIHPVYAGDFLLALAMAHFAVSRLLTGRREATGAAGQAWPGLGVAAFLAWALLRLAFGGDHGLVALRDFAPYGYALIAFLSANAYARSSAADRDRTMRIIELALVWHLVWVILVQLFSDGVSFADTDVAPFAIRSDTDGTVLAVTACLFLARHLRRGGNWRLVVVVGSLAAMLSMASRAPVLAALTGLALTLWYYLLCDSPHSNRGRQLAIVGMVPLTVVVVSFVLPQTPAGSKLLASTGIVRPHNRTDLIGLGTQRARGAAWRRLLHYTAETPTRETIGVGFGPHFMIESEASVALVGSDDPAVRSPHNYLLGTFARLGLLGLALFGLICLRMLAGIWRVRRFAAADDLVLLAAIVPPMILIPATVGVVLEAPFGAIPFFWFLGILLSKPRPSATSHKA
jgi:O-Antigen ligase